MSCDVPSILCSLSGNLPVFRFVFIFHFFGMIITIGASAISFSSSAPAWITLSGLCLFMWSFSLGMGALTFLVATEVRLSQAWCCTATLRRGCDRGFSCDILCLLTTNLMSHEVVVLFPPCSLDLQQRRVVRALEGNDRKSVACDASLGYIKMGCGNPCARDLLKTSRTFNLRE